MQQASLFFSKNRWRLIIAAVSVIIIAVVLVLVLRNTGRPSTITPEENNALWEKVNAALAGFMGEGFKTFGRDQSRLVTKEEVAPLDGYASDFSEALKAISGVNPPPE